MGKSAGLSGFPEWLPQGRLVELEILDQARRVFELHGFSSIETRSVEPVEVLMRKGEIDKEVYGVRRLQADTTDDALALHFDLTVPFARYVVENAGRLDFPLRRYQIQKVWRGERPQEGRYREFTQADIDIVDVGELSGHHEAEMALVMAEVFAALPFVPKATILVNNRKVLEGFYRGLAITDTAAVLRIVDKLDKIGIDKVRESLISEGGLSANQATAVLALAAIRAWDASFVEEVRHLGVSDPLLDEGLSELAAVITAVNVDRPGAVMVDLHIARGLDYYTGTVYETMLEGYESFGSVSSGGRYDALASDGRTTYPGVGISLGVTRLVSLVLGRDLAQASRHVPSAVLVAVNDEDSRSASDDVARHLRKRGIPCEVAPRAAKFGKQIKYADRRGIPHVWFLAEGEHESDSVKDIRTGEQVPADRLTWRPADTDLWPTVVATADEGAL